MRNNLWVAAMLASAMWGAATGYALAQDASRVNAETRTSVRMHHTVPTPSQGLDVPTFAKYYGGTVQDKKPVGLSGLIAWKVVKGDKHVILYTTADDEAMILGQVWNAQTGKPTGDDVFVAPSVFNRGRYVLSPTKSVLRYGGKIVESRSLGVGKLTGWLIEKNGKQAVLYTTPDAEALISGTVWERRTGKKVSTGLFSTAETFSAVSAEGQTPFTSLQGFAMQGSYTGRIPKELNTLASLEGIKEGSGAAADTVYVFFDPRCKYCSRTYRFTRGYVQNGYSIKWIPLVALGSPDVGNPLVAALLQQPTADTLNHTLELHRLPGVTPTRQNMDSLQNNMDFMMGRFHDAHAVAAVPAALFLDHRQGKLVLVTGIASRKSLESIFGPR